MAALVEAHYPGQEGGRSLADLLFDENGAVQLTSLQNPMRANASCAPSFLDNVLVLPSHLKTCGSAQGSTGFGRLIYSFYKSQAVMPPHTSMAFEGAGRASRRRCCPSAGTPRETLVKVERVCSGLTVCQCQAARTVMPATTSARSRSTLATGSQDTRVSTTAAQSVRLHGCCCCCCYCSCSCSCSCCCCC